MAALSRTEINEKLKSMTDWSHVGKALHRKYTLKSFMSAVGFVNKIAEAAETAGHHPDITINYSVVSIALSTHSESGVTQKDFDLAGKIDAAFDAIS